MAIPRSRVLLALGLPVLCAALYHDDLDFRDISQMEDRRFDFCDRQVQMSKGRLELRDALRGLHIDMVTPIYDPAWFDEPVGNTDPRLQTGFHVKLAMQLARLANFTYTIHSVPLSSFQPGMTWTEYLEASLQRFDLNLDWWMVTDERAALGVRPPLAFLDLSLVSVTHGRKAEATLLDKIASFAQPLSPGLWLSFLGLSIVTSLLYCWFEKDKSTDVWDRSDSARKKAITSIYMGFSSYTGSQHYVPTSSTGKVLSLTYSFFILLLVSAYTANLAVVLVVEASVAVCDSFNACIGQGKTVCVWEDTAMDHWLGDRYPQLYSDNGVVRTKSDPWPTLSSRGCDLVVDTVIEYKLAKASKELNPGCTLSRAGEANLQNFGGGWMSRADYAGKCSTVLRDSLAVHMLTLATEGVMERLMDEFIESQQTRVPCPSSSGQVEEGTGLPVDSMLGPFLIHMLGIVLAISLHLVRNRRRLSKQRAASKDSGADEEGLSLVARDMAHVKAQLDILMVEIGHNSQKTWAHESNGTPPSEECATLSIDI